MMSLKSMNGMMMMIKTKIVMKAERRLTEEEKHQIKIAIHLIVPETVKVLYIEERVEL